MTDSYFFQPPAQQRFPTSANGTSCGSAALKAEATSPYRAHHLQLRDNVLFLPQSSHLPSSITAWVGSSIPDFLLSFRFSSALLVLLGVRRREGRMKNWWQTSLQPIANTTNPGWAEHLPSFVIIWYGFFCSAKSKDTQYVSRLFLSGAPWPSGKFRSKGRTITDPSLIQDIHHSTKYLHRYKKGTNFQYKVKKK